MVKIGRLVIPIGLFIAIVVTLLLGLVAPSVINSLTTAAQRKTNVLLSAIPFILIFVAILLTYISLIRMSASVLNDHIPQRMHKVIETILIVGIVAGVIGMFQPWLMILYKVGFMVLLVSLLGFMWWGHVRPKGVQRQKETGRTSGQEVKNVET
jgi:lysylphosphatidylglycerol synthetase-like protein (DUF2156 family)